MEYLCKKNALPHLEKDAEKDAHSIAKLFADNIILGDRKIKGKGGAINETQKDFHSVDTLHINVLDYYENQGAIALALKITIDREEELYVMDIIEVNCVGKITSIKAFLGRNRTATSR